MENLIQTSCEIEADLDNLAMLRGWLCEIMQSMPVSEAARDDVLLAVNEVVTNTIVHGYRGRPGLIRIDVQATAAALTIRLTDTAPCFDPTGVPAPDLSRSPFQRPHGGLGLFLTRQAIDRLVYRVTTQGENELTLVKQCDQN